MSLVLLLYFMFLHEQSSDETTRIEQTVSDSPTCVPGWQGDSFIVCFPDSLRRFKPLVTDNHAGIECSKFQVEHSLNGISMYGVSVAKQSNRVSAGIGGHSVAVLDEKLATIYSIKDNRFQQIFGHSLSHNGMTFVTVRGDYAKDEDIKRLNLYADEIATGGTFHVELGRSPKRNRDLEITSIAIAPDDDLVIATHHSGQIDFVSLKQRKRIRSLHTPYNVAQEVKFSSDGSLVGVIGGGGTLAVFDTKSMTDIGCWCPQDQDGHELQIECFDFDVAGENVFVGFQVRTIPAKLHEHTHVSRIPVEYLKQRWLGYPCKGITQSRPFNIKAVHCSPDGKWIATVATWPTATEISFCTPEAFDGLIQFPPDVVPEVK